MNARQFGSAAVLTALTLGLAACRTGREPDSEPTIRQGQVIEFRPTAAVSQLHLADGRYPDLFSADSYALWVGPELTRQRRSESEAGGESIEPEADAAAPLLNENFLVFECHLVSVFADMSIAYDIVGLRGVQIYLLAPDGRRVPPAQSIIGTELEESQRGALKEFKRTNLIAFPRAGLRLEVPAAGAEGSAARLVIEGYDSIFYFEWYPILPDPIGPPPLAQRDAVQKVKMGYNEFYRKVRQWSHTFD